MSVITYEQKASEIIKNSIKSVIFIDENAVDFYTNEPDDSITEERLSKNLFNNFKENSVSLTVNKFDKSQINNTNYCDYLLKRRDLILLDWKLDNDSGEDYSLEILSKVIDTKSIHFCVIYTSEGNTISILNNIRSYFSGKTTEYYSSIKETIEVFDNVARIIKKVSFDKSENGKLFQELNELDSNLPKAIKEVCKINDISSALIQVKIAFLELYTSDKEQPIATNINEDSNIFNIKGTIVSIISKDEDDFDKIIDKLKTQLLSSPNHFVELLGLDMQSLFRDNSSFIDVDILDIDFNTVLNHRNQIIKNGSVEEFNDFINTVLLEQAKLNLYNSNLSIFEESFIENEAKLLKEMTNDNICQLNSFYNGSKISNKENLNFGDIFYEENSNNYYLCITALCDCLHPSSIKNNFFFIKASKNTDINKMIDSGDSGFKSFISDNIVIPWASITKEKDSIKYIKPFQLNIPNTALENDILVARIIDENCLISLNLTYIFTLKEKYAQRIANHAFNHPIRVGVDFVKK